MKKIKISSALVKIFEQTEKRIDQNIDSGGHFVCLYLNWADHSGVARQMFDDLFNPNNGAFAWYNCNVDGTNYSSSDEQDRQCNTARIMACIICAEIVRDELRKSRKKGGRK